MSVHKTRRVGAMMKSTRVRALLSLGIVLGLTSVSTLAYWTDTADISTATIEAGRLDLLVMSGQLPGQGGSVTNPAINATGVIPGESFAFTVPVQRAANTAPFSVTATATSTGALAPYLQWTVYEGTAGTSTTNTNGVRSNTCSGTALAAPVTLSGTPTVVIPAGSAVSLGGSTFSKNLCIRFSMPTTAPNAAQSQSGTATFNLTATQLP